MHLRDSIVLLIILLTGGFSLVCYNCKNQRGDPCEEQMTCDKEHIKCASIWDKEINEASCAKPDKCESWSFTTGNWSKSVSVQCCDTDLCNEQAAPDLYSSDNGRRCFSCDEEDCSHTVSCRGNEDYCFSEHDILFHTPVKGCASRVICDAPDWSAPGENFTCCSGNLCNAVERVTQSFLFLCCSLLSFILLH